LTLDKGLEDSAGEIEIEKCKILTLSILYWLQLYFERPHLDFWLKALACLYLCPSYPSIFLSLFFSKVENLKYLMKKVWLELGS